MTDSEIEIIGQMCPEMLNEVPVAVLLIENGIFVYCNQAAVQIFKHQVRTRLLANLQEFSPLLYNQMGSHQMKKRLQLLPMQ